MTREEQTIFQGALAVLERRVALHQRSAHEAHTQGERDRSRRWAARYCDAIEGLRELWDEIKREGDGGSSSPCQPASPRTPLDEGGASVERIDGHA